MSIQTAPITTTGSTQTWNWPTGVSYAVVEALGASGGSGGVSANPGAGGGGMGGGYARKAVTKGAESSLSVDVGVGGGGGAATGANGTAGGYTEVRQGATPVLRAAGGGFGQGGAASQAYPGGTTANGTALGDVTWGGGAGQDGDIVPTPYSSGGGGGAAGPDSAGGSGASGGARGTGTWQDGDTTRHANGAASLTAAGAGQAGANYGGGSSGGLATAAANRAGNTGAQGIALVSWYQPAVSAADSPVQGGQTGKTVTGTDFPTAATGSAKLELGSASDYTGTKVTQTVTSWGATSLTYTVVQGALSAGTVYAFVTDANGNRNATGYSVTLQEPTYEGAATGSCTVAATGTGIKPAEGSASGSAVATASASFNSFRRSIINGFDSAQSEAAGWDAQKANIPESAVERTSSTVATLTLPALSGYAITANETLTATVPGAVLDGGVDIEATPTITITAGGGVQEGTGSASGSCTVGATGTGIKPADGAATGSATVTGAAGLLVGLVAFWELEESSGTRADRVGNSTLSDGNTVTSNTGRVGTAAEFVAANNESLYCDSNAALATGDVGYTIAAWVYLADKSANYTILSKWGSTLGVDQEYALGYEGGATDRFYFRIGGTSAGQYVYGETYGAPAALSWHLVIGWHDPVNNLTCVSVNNVADALGWSQGSVAGSAAFNLGRNASEYFNGRLDQVGFWKRVLESSDRTIFYANGNGLSYAAMGGTVANVGAASGTCTVTAVGASVAVADGAATGSATALADASGASMGVATGSSTVTAVGTGIIPAAGTATGTATAAAYSGDTFASLRRSFIDAFVSAQSETHGWDNEKANIPVTAMARTSSTQATLTLPALSAYEITADEVLTLTIPAAILTGGVEIEATPTIQITATVAPPPAAQGSRMALLGVGA